MPHALLSALNGADPITRRQALARVASLAGGALGTSVLGGALAGCGRKAGGAESPALSPEQREMLATIADHIIPATDTPGARAAGVPQFIEAIWRECFSPAEQQGLLKGLAELDQRARRAHGAGLLQSDPARQAAVLAELDLETFRSPPPPRPRGGDLREFTEPGAGETPLPPGLEADTVEWRWGEPRDPAPAEMPFWRTVKRLTVVAYYTSEAGATEELRYDPVPGTYRGCVPLAEVGRTWAL